MSAEPRSKDTTCAALDALQKWSDAQPRIAVESEHVRSKALPVGADTSAMRVHVRELQPPAEPLLQAVLDASTVDEGRKLLFEEHWTKLHRTIEQRLPGM